MIPQYRDTLEPTQPPARPTTRVPAAPRVEVRPGPERQGLAEHRHQFTMPAVTSAHTNEEIR